MARRNLLRTLLSASLLFGSVVGGILATPSPAGAADNVAITIHISDQGFSPAKVDARIGDYLIFTLDNSTSTEHTVTWDDPSTCPAQSGEPEGPCWPEQRFKDDNQVCTWKGYVLPRT
ncbi:MAG: cupredoxin domain-containing protein, partial [Actinobacteria bacterium]|nr:cupredoxin domain-containing protein [Actinomycetota bacterium]